jgi:spore germination protein GerM
MNPDSPRDPTFARFAFAVITVALVVVVLGLTGIYYYFQSGGSDNPENPMANLFKRKTAGGLAPNQVMLYYTSDGKQLVATVADAGTVNMFPAEKARKIVESLLAGKDAAGLKSAIPSETEIVNIFLKDNIAIVNLSREFMTGLRGGVDAEMLAIYSIVNSLLFNLEGIDAVQILIDGERVPTLGGSLDINEPLIANTAITRTS